MTSTGRAKVRVGKGISPKLMLLPKKYSLGVRKIY